MGCKKTHTHIYTSEELFYKYGCGNIPPPPPNKKCAIESPTINHWFAGTPVTFCVCTYCNSLITILKQPYL